MVFDTNNVATLPTADPALAIARRWRYMVAGAGPASPSRQPKRPPGESDDVRGSATVRVDPAPQQRYAAW